MKKLTAILFICSFLSACTSSTEFGPCIGIADTKNPKLEYKVSKWNAFVAVMLMASVIVPIWVLADETLCPVAAKQ